MPTYVYRFVDTGETIEVQQSFDDAPLTEAAHPTTGDVMPVKKVFTPVGITFKGGGFYKNDSRSSGRSSTAPGSDPASSSTSSTSSPAEASPSSASPSSSDGGGSSKTTSATSS